MIRKLTPIFLAALIVCSFAGCRSRTNTGSVSSTVSNGGAVSTPKSSASPHTSASPRPENGVNDGNSVSENNGNGNLGNNVAGTAGIHLFGESLREVYGEKYYPDTKLTEQEIRDELGLDETLYEEVYAERSAQKAHPDMFVAVKAKNGKVKEVEEKLEAHKQKLLTNNDFAAHTEKINASKVYSEGDYVFFILLGDVEEGTSSEGMAEAFGKEVQRGIDAVKKAIGMR